MGITSSVLAGVVAGVNEGVVRGEEGEQAVAPTIDTSPVVSGVRVVGETLTVTPGTVSGSPTPSSSYAWLRNGSPIAGETGTTYVQTDIDLGAKIEAQQTATNASGSDSETTADDVVTFGVPSGVFHLLPTRGQYVLDSVLDDGTLAIGTHYTRTGTGYLEHPDNGTFSAFGEDALRRNANGALLEEAHTNPLSNSAFAGDAVGTPGTAPTGMTFNTPQQGLARTIVSVDDWNGLPAIEVRYQGTATGNGGLGWILSTSFDCSLGEYYTGSMFVAVTGGSTNGVGNMGLDIVERTAADAFISNNPNNISGSIDGTMTRYDHTHQMTNASVGKTRLHFYWNYINGQAIDITFRIAAPMLELGNDIVRGVTLGALGADTWVFGADDAGIDGATALSGAMSVTLNDNASDITLLDISDSTGRANNHMVVRVTSGELVIDGVSASSAQTEVGVLSGITSGSRLDLVWSFGSGTLNLEAKLDGGSTDSASGSFALPVGFDQIQVFDGDAHANGVLRELALAPIAWDGGQRTLALAAMEDSSEPPDWALLDGMDPDLDSDGNYQATALLMFNGSFMRLDDQFLEYEEAA